MKRTPNSRAAGVAAIVAALASIVLLAVTAPQQLVESTAAVPDDVGVPAPFAITETSPLTPFYDAPTSLEGPAGKMLKTQAVEGSPDNVVMSRIMYISENRLGDRIPVSGLLAIPKGTPPDGGYPLVAMSHGTTGIARGCGISLAPFLPNTAGAYGWNLQIKPLVEQGYAVVATDYEGMGAPGTPMYLIGQSQAQNVLDSVRAVHNTQSDVNADKTIVYGHSEGGLGALASAQLAPEYAPEVELDGLVAIAPGILPVIPFGLNAIIKSPEPTGKTSFMMQISRAWTAQFPDQLDPKELVTELGRTTGFEALATECGSTIKQTLNQPMGAYINSPLPNAIYPLVEKNTVPPPKIGVPVLIIQGMKDEAILPQANIAYFNYLCAAGNAAEIGVWENDNHNGVVVSSRPMVEAWLAARYDNQPASNDCPTS